MRQVSFRTTVLPALAALVCMAALVSCTTTATDLSRAGGGEFPQGGPGGKGGGSMGGPPGQGGGGSAPSGRPGGAPGMASGSPASLKALGMAVDRSGSIYVADTAGNRIRKITPSGAVATVAGTGLMGYSGDGGPAVSARLSAPTGLAVDLQGVLYVTDSANNRIRRIDRNGIITTVAGTGKKGYSGDGGAAVSAQLSSPTGIAVDAEGNIFVYDGGNGCVRRIDAGGIITTITAERPGDPLLTGLAGSKQR